MIMKLKFLGASQTVTGSKYLLTIDDKRYLFDCGLFQGKGANILQKNSLKMAKYPYKKLLQLLKFGKSVELSLCFCQQIFESF